MNFLFYMKIQMSKQSKNTSVRFLFTSEVWSNTQRFAIRHSDKEKGFLKIIC